MNQDLDRQIAEIEAELNSSADPALEAAPAPITMNGVGHADGEDQSIPLEDIVMSQGDESEAVPLTEAGPPTEFGPPVPDLAPLIDVPAAAFGAPGLSSSSGPMFPDPIPLPAPSLLLGDGSAAGMRPMPAPALDSYLVPGVPFQNPAVLRPHLSPFATIPATDPSAGSRVAGGDLHQK